ncbi:MAG: hypothetical protein KBT11_02250 [Treponema sp.]|nr:hypothetical protein [Candidatus Treponema equifaecale]
MNPIHFVTFFLTVLILIFFASFELSKPKARDLILVAELSAICVCTRAIFSFVPYFNPVVGLIMLFSVPLGVRKGFLIGALTALVSNFIFGQGLWTIFQMASWGIAGAVFGLLGNCGILHRDMWKFKDYFVSSVLAAILIVAVTGPITDLSGFVMMGGGDFAVLKVILLGGLIFNATLAASTVVTIILCSKIVLFALDRVSKK